MVDLPGIPTLSYQKGNKKRDKGILEGRRDVTTFKIQYPGT